jgi:hypothetical protein
MKKLQLENTSYTFADYFKLSHEIDGIVDYFGYKFNKDYLQLPRSNQELSRLDDLQLRLEENLRYATLTSEIAKREFLIAPVISDVIHYTHTRVRIEFPLVVDEQLKGSLDYLLESPQHTLFLVIEAKNGDLEQGVKQLAVELIALDHWLENDPKALLYGAVSIGNVWQFSVLQRTAKQLTQDLNLFCLPADVENLLRVMIGLLEQ